MNNSHYLNLYRNDLILKNYSPTTIENYVSQIGLFLKYFDDKVTEPVKINERQIKEWLLLASSVNSRKHRLSALKLFYSLTIHQPMKLRYIEYPRSEKKLPIILSVDEIQRMFYVCTNTKHRVILGILYACGLRVSELINLKWQHIDRGRMIINIIAAKGFKDRQVMLPQVLISLLEKYWREYHSKEYVLNGQTELQYSARSVGEVIKQLAERAGINKRVYTHLMRHCSFTHMVESGVDLNIIQRIAGHQNVKTTAIYAHISHNIISRVNSPINQISV